MQAHQDETAQDSSQAPHFLAENMDSSPPMKDEKLPDRSPEDATAMEDRETMEDSGNREHLNISPAHFEAPFEPHHTRNLSATTTSKDTLLEDFPDPAQHMVPRVNSQVACPSSSRDSEDLMDK